MTALLDIAPHTARVEPVALDDIALAEHALADLLTRCERMHRSNIQHDSVSCLICFGAR